MLTNDLMSRALQRYSIFSHKLPFIISLFVLNFLINTAPAAQNKDTYSIELSKWYNSRDSALQSLESPLNLIGVFNLKEGINAFGCDKNNDIVFEKDGIPPYMGQYICNHDSIIINVEKNVHITLDGKDIIGRHILYTKTQHFNQEIKTFNYGSLFWKVVFNDGKPTLRLLDTASIYHKQYSGVHRYPILKYWNIRARFEPYSEDTFIPITTVFGKTNNRKTAGIIKFDFKGKEYALEALDHGKFLFLTFSDSSNNKDSYAFRFLYVTKPITGNIVMLDFNKATNPNCAFSPYAACPLPPSKNKLPFSVEVGEKKYSIHQ